ncbi:MULTISPECIES: phosphoribosylformylglycinamidine synthase subunit PurQ [Fructobacillus]|jgi:phosphoribosylformylglycinamidine synthase subunit PurQ / glutaminase|uniref:Phosphoribosylformylglycinamidine synthase subunit PurQ n=1 Tax=Fructobacillus cardui TaxID=2893170 RepID=A0ABN9YQK4_9LACO|nr:phosphoribosylformylglycinamidine synthase subunit PurQ [Fructobacillus sp. EFB-N1]KMK52977.1 Phosphoribosylformylglycinamidine synthase 1 [Fructobacillus sp. EFB-N1]CAK1238694.1 Phosphoribosylformylglycinamidine (FGAM) synthase [Fructobacillus cardui]CAK1247180.1 Phosphoribosylformylglycinamidine (FGAM) synthase [Fructobacillus cardui]CAK1248356.1 Phosphoribosylformylglycinamidine (FGAM) synthase [Fructobacillus cardui]
MKAAVITFPGSNCDMDMYHALESFDVDVDLLDDQASDLSAYDAIFIPGGFSYGDYLRSGAVAKFSPAMDAVKVAAENGQLVVGICNGFQILTEAGLLPGQLLVNEQPGFICDEVNLVVENPDSNFTNTMSKGDVLKVPIAHGEGNYVTDEVTLKELEDNHQVIFRYQENVNGSMNKIAGITNKAGNVYGMMPHPERAVDALTGNDSGRAFFESLLHAVDQKARA